MNNERLLLPLYSNAQRSFLLCLAVNLIRVQGPAYLTMIGFLRRAVLIVRQHGQCCVAGLGQSASVEIQTR
jgi:hypothetical protein